MQITTSQVQPRAQSICDYVFIESGGECFGFRIWDIFAHILVFAVVGFSKCKLLHLNVTGDIRI
jgi:hypothetical protein